MRAFNIITSRENPLIKLVAALQVSSEKRRRNGLFVLEGLRICKDACDNGIRFDKLIVSDAAAEKYAADTEKFSLISDECYKIPDSLFKKISDTKTPQGIIAVAKMPVTGFYGIDKNGKYIALENVADPSNLGAVSRTAEALGVNGIILSSDGCDPYSPKALRASMGTLLRVPVFVTESFAETLKSTGLKRYACVVDKTAESIKEQSFENGSVVMIGNEANGLTDSAKQSADVLVTIPMTGRAESLNAAAAAAIAIWEMMK
ncbi:MAG TPA: RNA methyltransferase [Ruminococcaceae bacterium]|nr:RNA methyltransferase [Oscillospiraceae bacterium]